MQIGSRVPTHSTVYEEKCIFCDKTSKYKKGSNTREPLTKSCEFHSDEKIRSIAVQKMDSKMLSITSRELVAVEAHYHKSCYIAYTRQRPSPSVSQEEKEDSGAVYARAEQCAYEMLFNFIRQTLFTKPHVTKMVGLSEQLVLFMNMQGVTVVKSHTRKHIWRKLELEFGESLYIVPGEKGKLLVIPDNLTVQMIALEYMKLKGEFDALSNSQDTSDIQKNSCTPQM